MPGTELLIFPFSGNAKEALDAVDTQFKVIGFVDDNPEKIGQQYAGIPILDRQAFEQFSSAKVLAVPGSEKNFLTRNQIINSLNLPEERFTAVIHPKASIGKTVDIGNNVLILSGTVITSNAKIGNHCIILANSVIHHDCVIEDYAIIGSLVNIAGSVNVGRSSYIGSGSRIKNDLTIGQNSIVGMGANVIQSFGKGSKLVGNPARNIN